MRTKRTDEFRADAVRIALTSGLTRSQVVSDFMQLRKEDRHAKLELRICAAARMGR